MHSTRNNAIAGPGGRRKGFTLVELTVACLIVSVIMLSIVATFKMAMEAEARASSSWADKAAAAAIADEVADSLALAVDLPDLPGVTGRSADGAREVVCTAAAGRGLRRVRYAWAGGAGGALNLTAQSMPYAGKQNLLPAAEAVPADAEPQQIWGAVPLVPIASRLGELDVTFRQSGDAAGAWQEDWGGPAAGVLVRVRARVGQQVVERVVRPGVNAELPDAPAEGG